MNQQLTGPQSGGQLAEEELDLPLSLVEYVSDLDVQNVVYLFADFLTENDADESVIQKLWQDYDEWAETDEGRVEPYNWQRVGNVAIGSLHWSTLLSAVVMVCVMYGVSISIFVNANGMSLSDFSSPGGAQIWIVILIVLVGNILLSIASDAWNYFYLGLR